MAILGHKDSKGGEFIKAPSSADSKATTSDLDPYVSPIFKVHDDILLQIVQINADMTRNYFLIDDERITQEIPRAMNDIRNASQVNSLWRNLIVNAPRLWANLIDIEFLDQSREFWRKEVIRRTKDCSLRVKGSVSITALDKSEPWWVSFLNYNWHRVQKIDFDIRVANADNYWFSEMNVLNYAGAEKYRKALPFLSKPTSVLEYFCLSLPCLCDPLKLGATLFNNRAPRLTFFEVHNLRFNTQNSWIRQLRSLHILEFHDQTFKSGDELLRVLSQMPNLETLSLEDTIADPSVSVYQGPVRLPRLQYLCIKEIAYGNLSGNTNNAIIAFWPLLDRIIPQPGCSMKVHLSPSYSGDVDVRVLSRFARNYFQVHQPTKLDVLYGKHRFSVGDEPSQFALAIGPVTIPAFNFAAFLQTDSQANWDLDGKMYRAFEPFFGLTFTRVKALRLQIDVSNPKKSSLSCPQIAELLSTFTSVEHLSTTSETLDFLCESPAIDLSTLFPQLKVLKMPVGGFEPYYESGPVVASTMIRFFECRKEAGLPAVETLVYECPMQMRKEFDDLTFLDELVPGLEVVWTTRAFGDGRYVCGSGKAEELDFVKKAKLATKEKKKKMI